MFADTTMTNSPLEAFALILARSYHDVIGHNKTRCVMSAPMKT